MFSNNSNAAIITTSFSVDINETTVSRWIDSLDTATRTKDTYRKNISYFLSWLEAHSIIRPTRENIMAYRDFVRYSGLKPSTIQSYITTVRIFFSWLDTEGLYPNVAYKVKGAKIDNDYKKDYLTTKQVRNILSMVDTSTLQGKRDYAILSLMVTTGLRTISVISANIEDIGHAGDSSALYYLGKGHDEKSDYVKLSSPVEEAIRDYLTARGEKNPESPLFASLDHKNQNGRMTTRSISRIAKNSMVTAGYISDRLTAHSLRHTAATLNLRNGGSLTETQQLLGHKNIETTLRYSHILDREGNMSEERISKAIFE